MKRKIAAIDVGTTKVCTIMGNFNSSSGLRILGVGIAPSRGIEKGLVAGVDEVKESIRESVKKAQTMAGYKLESAFVGVNGKHIKSINNKGTVAMSRTDQLVRSDDLQRVLDTAPDNRTPKGKKPSPIAPKAYAQGGLAIMDPATLQGYDLDVEGQAVAQAMASVQNLTRCVKEIGIEIDDLILEPLATAEAVLREEEKRAGVLVANIGGGTTDIAVIKDGSLYHTSILPVAGNHITRDIAAGLGIPLEMAEELKKKYGRILLSEEDEEDKVVEINDQSFSYCDLCDVISIRVEELIHLMMLRMPEADFQTLIPSGIVLTGGSANLPGIVEMTQAITHLPVRVGVHPTFKGVSNALPNDPAYATSVGIILWKLKNGGLTGSRMSTSSGIRGFWAKLLRLFG